MYQLSFELNDGTIDFITFSKDFLDFLDDSDLFEVAETHFRKKYNDDNITVKSYGGGLELVEFEF